MKRVFALLIGAIITLSITACEVNEEVAVKETETIESENTKESVKQEDFAVWEYDESSKTLYLYEDIGGFEPDAENEAGTTTNAPWAEFLPDIENIVVGEKVTYIGNYAFAFCSNLKNVEVGQNATALEFRSFYKCGNGSEILMNFESNDLPIFGEDVFGYTWDNPNVIVSVPEGHEQHWADYLGGRAMQIEGYNQINLDDPNSIASVFISDMQFKTGGTPDGNMGEDFSYVAIKKNSEDNSYVEFGSDVEGASFTRGEHLYYEGRGYNQAVMFKFMPNDTQNLAFTIISDNEISMKFVDGVPLNVNMHNFSETLYSEYGPANITLESDKWYWALMAVDGNGTYRSAVWKEEDPMIGANFIDETGVKEGIWNWNISFGANQTLYIAEYIVFDFVEINKFEMNNGDNSESLDLGPSWAINIGGDFDIMSDMVWQSVELQDIKIGEGDVYKGYGLKELMTFAGHETDSATVNLVNVDSDPIDVDPTYDAYVVFKKNDEFLGGPYLLSMNGLSKQLIASVQPK